MQLARLVEVSGQVAATRSRLGKRDLIAALLVEAAASGAEEVDVAATYLSGTLRQRRTGVGWRALADLPPAASEPTVGLAEVDQILERLSCLSGSGSATARRELVDSLFGRLTAPEQQYLRALLSGNVRQGALDSVMLDAIAVAAQVPLAAVRRAAMFSGPTGPIARAALVPPGSQVPSTSSGQRSTSSTNGVGLVPPGSQVSTSSTNGVGLVSTGSTGGVEALERFGLHVGRPVRPMLAASAPDVAAAVEKAASPGGFAVDTKLDGIRIQVHKQDDEVLVFTRSLEEISARLPEVVAAARRLPARDLVLDGEALALDDAGLPLPFQDTASTTATRSGGTGIRPFFFDLLLADERSLIEAPLVERLAVLDSLVPEHLRVLRLTTDTVDAAARFYGQALSDGQEGVVVKRLDAPYDAGRRGSAWVKVKPRHTLDLVVLAVEWGSGRRSGWLSNIHLGARDPGTGDFVMLGKTFKGMTDEMLAWQTERFLSLETSRRGHVVHLRPEQVVEVAFDGVQRSTRYPGGVALRFARVLRYRDDKPVIEIDTIETVKSFGGR